jgi:hypothetical protein
MKTCPDCSQDLPDLAFGVDNSKPDALTRRCKACNNAYAKSRKGAPKDWVRKTQQPGYAAQKKKAYWARHPDKKAEHYRRKWEAKRARLIEAGALRPQVPLSPEDRRKRHLAHKIVYSCIKRGSMTKKPCEVCGEVEVHGHHPDYDRPRDVVWLCNEHHRAVHAMV